MGRPRKNGEVLHCIVDSGLVRAIEDYSVMTGLSKTAVVERALSSFLGFYQNDNNGVVEAVYLAGNSEAERAMARSRGGEPVIREEPCYFLGETTVYGRKYYRIVKDGQLMKVPENMVKFKTEDDSQ